MTSISAKGAQTIAELLHLLLLSLIFTSLSLFIFSSIAAASQDEAYGIVTNVVDGDTFDVAIEKGDKKVAYSVERIRLADVDSPEIGSESGSAARDFTFAMLMNKRVYLDIDDLSANGRDSYGRLICLAYLTGIYGQPIVAPNFNRLLVDSGHARMNNFTDNEFDPQNWMAARGIGEEAELLEGQEPDWQQELHENLLPRLQESVEKELDRAEKEILEWLKEQIRI